MGTAATVVTVKRMPGMSPVVARVGLGQQAVQVESRSSCIHHSLDQAQSQWLVAQAVQLARTERQARVDHRPRLGQRARAEFL